MAASPSSATTLGAPSPNQPCPPATLFRSCSLLPQMPTSHLPPCWPIALGTGVGGSGRPDLLTLCIFYVMAPCPVDIIRPFPRGETALEGSRLTQ